MKIFNPLFIASMMILLSASVIAQQKHATPEDRAKGLTQWMKSNLKLQEQQLAPVESINLKYANKVQEVQGSSQTRTQKMRSLRADGDAMDQELKRVLTADQFQAWIAKKEDVKKEWQEKIKAKKQGGY